jgi:hypothetical protein
MLKNFLYYTRYQLQVVVLKDSPTQFEVLVYSLDKKGYGGPTLLIIRHLNDKENQREY